MGPDRQAARVPPGELPPDVAAVVATGPPRRSALRDWPSAR